MKKYLIAMALALVSSPAFAGGWHLCQQPTTINQLYNFLNTAGHGDARWTEFLKNNVQFVQSDFVDNRHRQGGDYSLTSCKATFNVTTPNGHQFVWTQPYVVRYTDLYEINMGDADRFAWAVVQRNQ